MEKQKIQKCILYGALISFVLSEINPFCLKCFIEKKHHLPENNCNVNLSTSDFSTRTANFSNSVSGVISTITTQPFYNYSTEK